MAAGTLEADEPSARTPMTRLPPSRPGHRRPGHRRRRRARRPLVVGRRGRIGRRGGLRLSVGLARWWARINIRPTWLGWGPVHAELAAELAMRLGSWWCVLVGEDGTPQAVIPVRRRPPPPEGRPAGQAVAG